MPIKGLDHQQRLRQLGEIRIGHAVRLKGVDRRGKPKIKPEKLSKFRLTSPDKGLLEQVAALYGGEVVPWSPANGDPDEWQVYTQTAEVPILIPPRSTTLWYELQDGRRLERQCDGETEKRRNRPCVCNPDKTLAWNDKRECDISLRLNVMLRDLPAIGVWLLKSKGRNAAVEIPMLAEIVASAGQYVSARLGMEARTTWVLDEPAPFHYMVPVIHVDQKPLELMAGGDGRTALGPDGKKALGGGPKAIGAAPMAQDDPGTEYWVALVNSAPDVEALTEVLAKAQDAGRAKNGDPLFGEFARRRRELELEIEVVTDAEIVDEAEDGIAVAEIVDDAPTAAPAPPAQSTDVLDELWFAITEFAPEGWDSRNLSQAFANRTGVSTLKATEQQLREFLAWLQTGGAQ